MTGRERDKDSRDAKLARYRRGVKRPSAAMMPR